MNREPLLRKPEWIRITSPSGTRYSHLSALIKRRGLHTVCDEAHCPNKAECWGCGTATFMIMGSVCTRACRFCAVATASKGQPLMPKEPEELSAVIEELKLRYAVITSVDRDDLNDKGASHYAACIRAVKQRTADVKVEVLIPDYGESELTVLLQEKPDTLAHNIETVERLQHVRDPRASYAKSLKTLRTAKQLGAPLTKSSLMLGLGETKAEVFTSMDDLRSNSVDILVLGQYLQPTRKQVPVVEYVHPDVFELYKEEAESRGFSYVVAGPFARTSYHAQEAWDARSCQDMP